MQITVKNSILELVQGDIVHQEVEAIVNAANTTLLGGGGVDGAIHRVAGPELLEHCKKLGGCNTGDAKLTPGFRLKARYVIHTVGPVYRDGKGKESALLASCYQRSLEVAKENQIKSIAFPSISTGAYRYPLHEASRIALDSITHFLDEHESPEIVRFVLFGEEAFQTYRQTLLEISRKHP